MRKIILIIILTFSIKSQSQDLWTLTDCVNRALKENISIKQALKHPIWQMGQKITIDSSTLMNKALEIIEAKYLFDQNLEKFLFFLNLSDTYLIPQACFLRTSFA